MDLVKYIVVVESTIPRSEIIARVGTHGALVGQIGGFRMLSPGGPMEPFKGDGSSKNGTSSSSQGGKCRSPIDPRYSLSLSRRLISYSLRNFRWAYVNWSVRVTEWKWEARTSEWRECLDSCPPVNSFENWPHRRRA